MMAVDFHSIIDSFQRLFKEYLCINQILERNYDSIQNNYQIYPKTEFFRRVIRENEDPILTSTYEERFSWRR